MCGIVGAIGVELTDFALSSLRHRGPDGHGKEHIRCGDRDVWLGHTRLAILDLSAAGHQPMRSRDGRWLVTFNGEIYNHTDFRKQLEDTRWRGHSDTETLVELIAAKGIEHALPHLNGMFAFAALDTQQNRLYLVRDAFGIKPLYFFHDKQRFAFSSEVRALRALGVLTALDEAGLRQFLALRYVPSPSTLWRGIQRLPPGHVAKLDLVTDVFRIESFVQSTTERFHGGFDTAVEAYRAALARAVERQLLSDVPVGVLLSGGVDSAVVAAKAKDAGRDLPCFTVGFGGGHAECEIEDARETARVLRLPFHAIVVSPEDLRAALPEIVRVVEEPLGTTSIMPMWYLVQRARQDVTVVLTGQGADEPWGGYFRYQVELLREKLPWPFFWQVLQTLLAPWPGRPEVVSRGLASLAERDAVRRVLAACALFSPQERRRLVGDADDGGASNQMAAWLAWLRPGLDGPERMMRLDTRMNLGDDLLLYGDKIAMAVSLEARVPMLDMELVRFIESLPIEYRVRWRHGKVAHKAMAERDLPQEVVHRPKKGFQVPFGAWSRGAWRAWVEMRLLDGLKGLLQREGVEQLWREHLACKPDRSRQMFALLMLALWQEEYR